MALRMETKGFRLGRRLFVGGSIIKGSWRLVYRVFAGRANGTALPAAVRFGRL